MSEGNKAVVRRLVEEWQDGRRVEVAEELIADDFVDHSAGADEKGTKEEGIQWFQHIWQALPDFSVEIKGSSRRRGQGRRPEDVLGNSRGRVDGPPSDTEEGGLRHIRPPPYSRRQSHLTSGVYDIAGLMQQLGAMSGADD